MPAPRIGGNETGPLRATDELFEAAADHRSDEHGDEGDRRRTQQAVQRVLGRLSDRERQILTSRFGLGGTDELTLERIGPTWESARSESVRSSRVPRESSASLP